MEKNKSLQYMLCPLTKLIFCDPVVAEDGYIYEQMAIKEHFENSSLSPITGEKIGDTLIQATGIRKMVDEFLTQNPEYKTDQFLFKRPYYLFSHEFARFLKEKKYSRLTEFTNIILNTDIGNDTLFELVCKSCPDEIIKYVIDNCIDYDTYNTRKKIKPIHTVCANCSPEIIMHLINKKVDLESEDANGERALGYIILYKKKDIIDQLLPELFKLNVDVNYINRQGHMPSHYTVNVGDVDTLKMFINNGLNLTTISQKKGGMNLIQYAFKECPSIELINYLISLDINLDVDVDPKTPSEYLIYLNRFLDKKEKQKLVHHYLTKLLKKATIVVDFIDSV